MHRAGVSPATNGCQKGVASRTEHVTTLLLANCNVLCLQYDTVVAAMRQTVEKFGKIDILVNSTSLAKLIVMRFDELFCCRCCRKFLVPGQFPLCKWLQDRLGD